MTDIFYNPEYVKGLFNRMSSSYERMNLTLLAGVLTDQFILLFRNIKSLNLKIMRTLVPLFISIIFFNQANCQDKVVKGLMEQVVLDHIPVDFKYFNLIDTGLGIILGKGFYKEFEFKNIFMKKYNDFPLEYFIAYKASTSIIWLEYQLPKAKVYTYAQIPKFQSSARETKFLHHKLERSHIDSVKNNLDYTEIAIVYRGKLTRKRASKISKRKWRKHDMLIRKEDKSYFNFSNPIFSKDFKYAIVEVSTGSSSAKFIYLKTDNEWKQVFQFDFIVS